MKALCEEDEGFGLKMAPLIDVVFLLLIFFLVATTFYESEKDITIRLAEATEGASRDQAPQLVVVNISAAGVIVVNQRVMTLEQLAEHLTAAKARNPVLAAVVRCDRQARHADFVKVLNLCEKVKVTQVAVATFQTDE
jgi:biopolymer transport protein ExbD